MSADRLGLVVCGVCLGTGIVAAEQTPPDDDTEFLEYLGMWEESDEEWVLQEGILTAEDEIRSDRETEEEESPESDDES
jgi:hypothetical protein